MRHNDQQSGTDEPEDTVGELARSCGLCRATIAAEFFTLRGLRVCPACASGIASRQQGRGKTTRAVLFGAIAAAACAAIWFFATRASSQPFAGLAVLAGVAVGLAVHRGSGGRGGLRYQLTAALLVYTAFIARYVPPVFGGIADSIKHQHAASRLAEATAPLPAPATIPGDTKDKNPPPPTPAMTSTPATSEQTSRIATLKAYLVFTLVAWGLVLAAPFMPGSGTVSLIFLAIGMALAWRLNRRARISGPFSSAG